MPKPKPKPAAPLIVLPKHPLVTAFDLLRTMGEPGEWIWQTRRAWAEDKDTPWSLAEQLEYLDRAITWQRARLRDGGLDKYRHIPVDPQTFVECPALMNKRKILWPGVLPVLREINDGTHVECVLTGAIGVAKTTLALYTQAFQQYLLSAYRSAHAVFDLDPSSEILTVFQSISKNLSLDVDYRRFRDMIDNSPYFARYFPFSRDRESDLRFPHNVIVKPVAGHDQAAIGQNVIGGILDEVNFMAVVEKSKLATDGGIYDQAVSNYNAIAQRRESRFMVKGTVPGMLCLVGSRNYPGQFTDMKEREARANPRIYVYDRRLWEIRPEKFIGPKFRVFVGDETRKPRMLDDKEAVRPEDVKLVVEVPIEYRQRFEADILAALRDVAGVSTVALHPFIMDTQAVAEGFGTVESIGDAEVCDFVASKLIVHPERFLNPQEPRFVHVDLGVSSDSAGVAIGCVPAFKAIQRGDEVEMLPLIRYDLVLEVRPPRGGEVEFENIRRLLYMLRDLGLNIRWVTFDSFQSVDSMQMLRQRGFIVGVQSVDEKPDAYNTLKQAFYDRRVLVPAHAKAQLELVRLERDPKTRKIDHPTRGSKDCSDAMAGVAYGLTMRRDVWRRHGISLNRIPRSVMAVSERPAKLETARVTMTRRGRRNEAGELVSADA